MSKEAREHVRKHSRRKGGDLLLLLAIAEYADKEGLAWPSVSTLARDIRMTVRHTIRLVAKLGRTDELKVRRNAGPKGTHLYQLNMGLSLPLFEGDNLSADKMSPPDFGSTKGVTSATKRGDTAMSPEPLNQRQNRQASARSREHVDNWTPPAAADLKFPQGTTARRREALLAIAKEYRLGREQLQLAFDEVDDRLERREHVGNVVALTKAIAKQIRDGTFYGERAERHAQKTRGGGRPLTDAELKLVSGGKKAA